MKRWASNIEENKFIFYPVHQVKICPCCWQANFCYINFAYPGYYFCKTLSVPNTYK